MTMPMLEKLNELEKASIVSLRSHAVLSQFKSLSPSDYREILLQRRFLSLQITLVYELVIDALQDTQAKYTVRKILHEEYPRSSKGIPLSSHRELLFQDLINLGIGRSEILATDETAETQSVRESVIALLRQASRHPHCNVALLSGLRFWAEALVSVEYQCFWPKLSESLASKPDSNKPRSEFYFFHMLHDSRGTDIGQEKLIGGMTHSQELGTHIHRLLKSESELNYSLNLLQQLCRLKSRFYDQFLPLVLKDSQPQSAQS